MSDLKFTCATCGQPILVGDETAGQELACPSCKTELTVPMTNDDSRGRPVVEKPRLVSGDRAVPEEGKGDTIRATRKPIADESGLEELMARAARDEVVSTHELLRSVHRELTKLNRRLDEIERSSAPPAVEASDHKS